MCACVGWEGIGGGGGGGGGGGKGGTKRMVETVKKGKDN